MDRRRFVQFSALVGIGAGSFPIRWPAPPPNAHNRVLASRIEHIKLIYPKDKRIPLGWPVFGVPLHAEPTETTIYFPKERLSSPVYLRITAAMDFREEKVIEIFLLASKKKVGEYKITFAHPFQPFEIPVSRKVARSIQNEGVGLRLVGGTGDAWFYGSEPSIPSGFQPHLLAGKANSPEESFFENLYSLNSFSPFGWMGGSVQDALYELFLAGDQKAGETLRTHLSNYLDEGMGIRFENPHTSPMDGTFNSLEDFLPFTAIVALYPKHKAVQQAVEFMLDKRDANGVIGGGRVTTEGCYTLAYPLMAIAIERGDRNLAQIAIDQLMVRMKHLTDETAVYQRAILSGTKAFRNWGRGIVWYMLGLVKTVRLVRDSSFGFDVESDELKRSFVHLASVIREYQDGEGLWKGYVDSEDSVVDTSATGGIAAAFAWGVGLGWLDSSYLVSCNRAYQGLLGYVSADGFLRSVSQINRGGEELQQSPYRVISQFGMGLMAQLKVALMRVPTA